MADYQDAAASQGLNQDDMRQFQTWARTQGGMAGSQDRSSLFQQMQRFKMERGDANPGYADQGTQERLRSAPRWDAQQPQASRMQQGPEATPEQPTFGQEGYGDMIRQRRQQQGNPNSLEALRQRATNPQQRIATNKQYPTGSQFAGTRPSTRTGIAYGKSGAPQMTPAEVRQIEVQRDRHQQWKPGEDQFGKIEYGKPMDPNNPAHLARAESYKRRDANALAKAQKLQNQRFRSAKPSGQSNQMKQGAQLSNRDRRLMNYTPPAKGRWNRESDRTRFNQLQGMKSSGGLSNLANRAKTGARPITYG